MKIKVMEYNILTGLCDECANGKYKIQKKRVDAAVKVVRGFDPDLLVLCEASLTPEHKKAKKEFGTVMDYAKIFGYRYAYYGVRSKRDGTTVLSKYPLEGHNFSLSELSFVRVKAFVENKEIMIDAVHPHPLVDNDDKMMFVKSVTRDLKKPYILTGDFNAVSPDDIYDRKTMIRGFRAILEDNKDDAPNIVSSILERKAISYVLEHGLIDTYRAINQKRSFVYTNPTRMFAEYKDTAMRLDFIFCSNDFKVIDAGIIKDKTADIASDHYPTYAILELN
jgi:exonuclease III